MAQRRFDNHARPGGSEPSVEIESRAAIGMGWLAQLKLRRGVANDNRASLWLVAASTILVLLAGATLIFALLSALG